MNYLLGHQSCFSNFPKRSSKSYFSLEGGSADGRRGGVSKFQVAMITLHNTNGICLYSNATLH